MWDTTQWYYNAATGTYKPNIVEVATPPAGAKTVNTAPLLGTINSSSLASSTNPSDGSGAVSPLNAQTPVSNLLLGQNSSKPNLGSTNNGAFDLFYNAAISNNIVSSAKTGDATVANNTQAGSATTGNAQAIANILNLLSSTWGLASGNPVPFVANIVGNVVGDLFIDPSQMNQPAPAPATPGGSITINAQNSGTIDNTINLNAASGNAGVLSNTNAGSATSGNADAMANVMNFINSSIASGQSFIGMLNIYGNLNGDILLPQGMLNNLLADNTGAVPLATQTPGTTKGTNTVANLTDNQTINNQISANATTGTATVSKNTSAGNATTGNANTNVTIFNMTGKQVVGKDALLVFVNVLGHWVGMIMNAPGATAGLIGGSATQSSLPSTNTTINATNSSQINNNITANAASGNATVSKNTSAGNATTGNANAGVNVMNLTNSSFSLSDWFGILFINVLGNWYGSFGVNTAAGNPIVTPTATATSNTTSAPKVFSFVPKTANTNTGAATQASQSDSSNQGTTTVLGSTSSNPPASSGGTTDTMIGNTKKFNWWLALVGPTAAIFLLLGGRIADLRRSQNI